MGPDANKEIGSSEKFRVLNQNATITEARVILLGDRHTDMGHDIDIQQFINGHINNGDVVLLEGINANKEVEAKKNFHTDSISKDVLVYGWDDISLRDQAASNVRQLMVLKGAIIKAQEEGNDVVGQMLNREFWKLKEDTDQIAIVQRNQSLMKVLTKVAGENPGKKIFIRGGSKHFSSDPDLTKHLSENYKYIALEPTSEDTVNREEKLSEYFGVGKDTIPQVKKETQSVNKVITVQLPDGTTKLIGAAWFLNGDSAKVGDSVFVDEKIGLESDRKHSNLNLGEGYKVIEVHK